ncbi:MAG: GntP family permease, partial [Verrucomicrobiota bacterium]
RKTGKNYLLYILCMVAGGTMAHSLIPPTPGPLFVAEELEVDLGTMMLVGLVIGLFPVGFGYAYAHWANRKWDIPLREEGTTASVEDGGALPGERLPLWMAGLPILLPVALIMSGSILKEVLSPEAMDSAGLRFLAAVSEKNMALTLSAMVAILLVLRRSGWSFQSSVGPVQKALLSGAGIILITSAGGAFGAVLRQTGIADSIQNWSSSASGWALPTVFLVTMLVRTAQGSATVAMITAAPIAVAFADSGNLGFHPVYLAVVIGCGSKPIPWMNDSGFWVITRMTGMKEAETLKIVTPMMSLMGVVGLLVTMVAARILPLVS